MNNLPQQFEQPAREYLATPSMPSDVLESELRTGGIEP
jgi:hypothetical protein